MKSDASLDWLAKILTTILFGTTILLLYLLMSASRSYEWASAGAGAFVLGAMILYCYLYSVKDYQIKDNQLVVNRIMGAVKFDLSQLRSVERYPDIKKGISIRTFGNGGLFGYFGHFYNDGIGRFKMYSTRYRDFWILSFGTDKIGISPDHPAFIEFLKKQAEIQS